MKEKLNIGIIGAGRIGKLHAENIAFRIPEANLVAITEVEEKMEDVRQFMQKTGISCSYTEDRHIMLNDENIDAIAICSSTDTHAQFIIEAAKAGKHIFCEKPIALNLAEIDRALRAVKKTGVKLQIGFNRRFDPHFAAAKEAIDKRKIGYPHILTITSYDPAPPSIDYIKKSGGIFKDMTIHDFDMARFLIQSEVEELFAKGAVFSDKRISRAGDIDTAIITLKFKNGTVGTITNCREAVYGYDQRVEVLGSKGKIKVENPIENTVAFSDGLETYSSNPLNFFMDRYVESYIREMYEFAQAIWQNEPVPVTGLDGRIPIIMALAAQKSLKEKRVVKISEIKGGAA